MKNQIIMSLIGFLPKSVNQSNFDRHHIAFFPKSMQEWASLHLTEIRALLRIAIFIIGFALPSLGFSQVSPLVSNVTDSIDSFTSFGVIELNRCNDVKKVSIFYLIDSILIGDNLILLENRKVTQTYFGYVVSFETKSFEGYINFDSDGLSSVVVYSGKNRNKISVYTTNYTDDKAEFLNNRKGYH